MSTSSPALGNPGGIALFWSAAADQPTGQFMDHQDLIAYDDHTVIVPEPAGGLLLAIGIFAWRRRVTHR